MADRQFLHSRHTAASRAGAGQGAAGGATGLVRTRPAAAQSAAAVSTASTATAAVSASASASAAPGNVRRNLFQSQLRRTEDDRRGVGAERKDRLERAERERERDKLEELQKLENMQKLQKQKLESGPVEIIVRDCNGDIALVEPPSPTADELNEMMAAPPLDARQESERERQRLADTIKYHQQRTNIPGQPEELLDALRASLRAKVAALSEDNWMYEPEDMPRVE